ncbi:glyoxylate reductase [Labrenzia sp. EL_142]|nr:glyoxylate reductase [Labrenzia sp. EL_142]
MMTRPTVLVTRRWPAAVEAVLSERYDTVLNTCDVPLSPAEIRRALKTFDAVLPTVTDRLDAEALDVPDARTRILANFGYGYAHICEPAARQRGLTVTNTPDNPSECTADFAMMLLLMAGRRACEGERNLRAGNWSRWCPDHLIGTRVSGKTLGIIGFGNAGQELARRAHYGFGMRIVVQDEERIDPAILEQVDATQAKDVDDLLPLCDFVSLHCAEARSNEPLIGARRLNLMKADAFLINTARGDLVDEAALVHALIFETIGGAALDVFVREPRINADLLNCDNLVLLPHLGGATRENREAMGFRVLENLSDFFDGRDPRDRVI